MSKPRLSESQWLAVRAVIFPITVLLPFLWKQNASCPTPITVNDLQCLTNEAASTSWLVVYYTILTIMAVCLLLCSYNFRTSKANAQRFVFRQLIIATITVVITTLAYVFIRHYSQGNTMYEASVAPDGATLTNLWLPIFGIGIPPLTYSLVAGLYMLTPLYQWFMPLSQSTIKAAKQAGKAKRTSSKKR